MANYYYSGQGSLYIAERDAMGKAKGFTPLGNVPELTLNIETTKFEHKESESGQRLIDLTVTKEKKGMFEFKLDNLNLDNLSMSLWGTKATVAGATVAAENVAIPADTAGGVRFTLDHPTVSAVVVKDSTDATTYVLDTDYTVDAKNGVIILKAGGAIVTAAALLTAPATHGLHIGYTYGGYTKVDAFTASSAPERWLRFEGINTVDDKAVIVDLFKAQFDPMTGYALINDELGTVSLKGSLLSDALQLTGSKFFRQINVS